MDLRILTRSIMSGVFSLIVATVSSINTTKSPMPFVVCAGSGVRLVQNYHCCCENKGIKQECSESVYHIDPQQQQQLLKR
eukprot:scaffold6925_cov116-Cylindrotheca_fusiformis.AAC.4